MMKRKPKLLSKFSILFIVFLIVAIGISAIILLAKANKHVESSVNASFKRKQEYIERKLKSGKIDDFYCAFDLIELENSVKPQIKPDKDTLMTEGGELQLYKIREKIIYVNGKSYLLLLKKNINDFTELKADIAKTLIPVFIILSIIILLLVTFLSKFLFKPFNHILNQMKSYKVGQTTIFRMIKTNTREFYIMQELYMNMIKRAEEDYINLKEYTENMSHEFQTPLAIIRSKTENLIADEKIMKNHTESVKSIYDETNHLSKLGSTLKLITKIENNEFVNKEQIVTKNKIEEHIEKLRELAMLKFITIESNLDSKHTWEMDPFLFEIILKNLLRNAVLYSVSDSIIKVETNGSALSVSNRSDANKVIPKNLFKRFSKGRGNPTSLGLGLAIVKKICDLNGLIIIHRQHNSNHIFTISPVNLQDNPKH